MKHRLLSAIAAIAAVACISTTAVLAAETGNTTDIPIGQSNTDVQMVGNIEPSIMSVTIPSYVPFHISRSIETENKVVSPRIVVKNNSAVPVELTIQKSRADISSLPNTTWATSASIGPNQIAIGLKLEEVENVAPTNLVRAFWLSGDNSYQNTDIMSLNAYATDAMYVVGNLGAAVPENKSFTVTPTFVVRRLNV